MGTISLIIGGASLAGLVTYYFLDGGDDTKRIDAEYRSLKKPEYVRLSQYQHKYYVTYNGVVVYASSDLVSAKKHIIDYVKTLNKEDVI